jgi:hypothetical protein
MRLSSSSRSDVLVASVERPWDAIRQLVAHLVVAGGSAGGRPAIVDASSARKSMSTGMEPGSRFRGGVDGVRASSRAGILPGGAGLAFEASTASRRASSSFS